MDLVFEVGLTNTHANKKLLDLLESYKNIKGIQYSDFFLYSTKKRIVFFIKDLRFLEFYLKGPLVDNLSQAEGFIKAYQAVPELKKENSKYRVFGKITGKLSFIDAYFLNLLNCISDWNPILWILYLVDNKIRNFSFKNLNSSNVSYSDFYFSPCFTISSTDVYFSTLYTKGIDLNSFSETFKKVECTFCSDYIKSLPEDAIKNVIVNNFKGRLLFDSQNKLINQFIINCSSDNLKSISAYTSALVNAYLSDIYFFYNLDINRQFDTSSIKFSNIFLFLVEKTKVDNNLICQVYLCSKLDDYCLSVSQFPFLRGTISSLIAKKAQYSEQVVFLTKDRVSPSCLESCIVLLSEYIENLVDTSSDLNKITYSDPLGIKKIFDNVVSMLFRYDEFNFSIKDLSSFTDANFTQILLKRAQKIDKKIQLDTNIKHFIKQKKFLSAISDELLKKFLLFYKRIKNLTKKINLNDLSVRCDLYQSDIEKRFLNFITVKPNLLDCSFFLNMIQLGNNFLDSNLIFLDNLEISHNRQKAILNLKYHIEKNLFLITC